MAQVDFADDPARGYVEPQGYPVPGGRVETPQPFDLAAEYRSILGRDPDAGEIATEPTNVGLYGIDQLRSNLRDRKTNQATTGGAAAPRGMGPLFDDAASNQLQQIAQAQMGEVRSNPRLNSLMSFLDSEFTRLSTNPGFSPEETAMLHTQALEPIESRRQASNVRARERAGARGFLPTSGLTYLTDGPSGGPETLDTSYDRMRTTADRDLALAGQQQRRADLVQALQLGQLGGLEIPRSQRSEELSLARVPYQMGRDALSDLLAVLGSSPSSTDVFNQSNQSAQQSYQERLREDERNGALMEEIGSLLAGIFR